MKKLKSTSFIACLLFFNSVHMNAQNNSVFPDSNAIWRDYSWLQSVLPSHMHIDVWDDEYSMEGDTVLGLLYTKIYQARWYHTFDITPSSTLHDSVFSCGYYGAVRSDSSERVYFFASNDTMERLFYDFSQVAGDTMPYSIIYGNSVFNINIVKSVDSILIANQYHKQLNICTTTDTTTFVSLIKGIGSTKGLFPILILPTVPPCWYVFSLSCLYLDSINVFSSPTGCASPTPQICNLYSCSSATGLPEIADENRIKIYPCPFRDYLNIMVNKQGCKENIFAFILDETGRIIRKEKISDSNNRIDCSGIKSGFYIIRLISATGFMVQRKIIKI